MLRTDFDHADQHISLELIALGQQLRSEDSPVYNSNHGGFWVASRHADIVHILRQPELFICSRRITLPPQNSPVPVIPLESDPPDHAFYRAVLTPFLTPRAVLAFEPRIRAIVREALDSIVAKGGGDAMADLAARIPTRAMAMIFGFSDDDAYRFDAGFAALVNAAGGDAAVQLQAVDAFKAFLLEKIEERRENPGDTDLVSAILRFEQNGRTYTEDECLGLMWSAAGGAIDTTKLAIGHAVRELGIDEAARQRLIDDPAKIPAAVEESLRLNASAYMTARYVERDTRVGNTEMKAGDRVLLVHGWGNRDTAVFDEPDRLKLDRAANRHLTFGNGIHMCAGMHLARLELRITLEELLRAMPHYELVDPQAGAILHGGMMWGYDELPIRIP